MSGPRRDEHPWQVKIRDAQGTIAGAGVLVSSRHILTCAHVVDPVAAEAGDTSPPDVAIQIDFPSARNLGPRPARVAEGGWFPIRPDHGQGDIAVLELDDAVKGIPAARLWVPDSYLDRQVSVCGYPRGVRHGVWAAAKLGRRNEPGWVQLDADMVSGQRVEKGFSGAGVVDANTETVVGIVVAELQDRVAKVAWMLPMEVIADFWPPLADRVEKEGGVVSIGPLDLMAVAECSAWEGSHEISAVTASGGLLRRWWGKGTGWSHWYGVEVETPVNDVAATSLARGRMTCVVTDAHGRAWRSSSADGRWTGWHQMSVPEETASPAIVRVAAMSKRDGHHEIFAVTGAGELVHCWGWEHDAWSEWHDMQPPAPVLDVAATSSAEGHMECMLADVHGRTWRRSAVESDWEADWHRMRLPATLSPALVRIAATRGWPGHREVFAVTGAGELVHSWSWEKDAWSEDWHVKKTPVAVRDVAATSNSEGHIECVITGTDGRMWRQSFSDEWSSFDMIHDLLSRT